MTQSFAPDSSPRVPSTNDAINYDDATNAEIAYPNSWTVPAGGATTSETVEQEHPRLFYTQEPHSKPATSDTWRAGFLKLDPGATAATAPVLLLGPNPKRKALTLTSVTGDAGSVYVGPDRSISNLVANGAPSSGALVSAYGIFLCHTGAVYAIGVGGACHISFVEETYP